MVYLRNVVTLELDQGRCIGCGTCQVVCPHGVFGTTSRPAQIIDRDACMECGACALNCPVGAVSVEAGVGCAAAVINSMLGRKSSSCCCTTEPKFSQQGLETAGRSLPLYLRLRV